MDSATLARRKLQKLSSDNFNPILPRLPSCKSTLTKQVEEEVLLPDLHTPPTVSLDLKANSRIVRQEHKRGCLGGAVQKQIISLPRKDCTLALKIEVALVHHPPRETCSELMSSTEGCICTPRPKGCWTSYWASS